MIGEVNPLNVRIDYTKVAEPLTIEQIAGDTDEVCAKYAVEPEELIMWEHQLDWLAKPHAERGRRAAYYVGASSPPQHPRAPEVYGIKVRLA